MNKVHQFLMMQENINNVEMINNHRGIVMIKLRISSSCEELTVDSARVLAEFLADIDNVGVDIFVIGGAITNTQQLAVDESTKKVSKETDDNYIPLTYNGQIIPLDDIEKLVIKNALKETDYNMSRTATKLGIGRTTLYRKTQKHNINIVR